MADFEFDPMITPVDVIELNGSPSPGTAKITGLADKRKFDEQISMYTSGGILIYRGRPLCRFTCTLTFAEAQDWIDWAAWRSIVARPLQGQLPKALTIVHPWTAMCGVHEVVVEEVGQPEEGDETGIWTVAIKFIEFNPPKPSFAKPDAAATKSDDDPDTLKLALISGQNLIKAAKLEKLQRESH